MQCEDLGDEEEVKATVVVAEATQVIELEISINAITSSHNL